MKIIYTILFFTDATALFALAYTFIKISNSETSKFISGLVFVAIVACINLLAYLLYRVMKSHDSNNENLF